MNEKSLIVVEELFYALSSCLVFFGFLELSFGRLVLAYINLNYLLLAWLLVAIILLCARKTAIKP